jgi:hypothetical protein
VREEVENSIAIGTVKFINRHRASCCKGKPDYLVQYYFTPKKMRCG